MRIFGQIAELTKVLWRKNGKTVELTPAEPTVSTVLTIPDPGDAADEVVLKDTAQTLTTKTIDADNNIISNLETDNLKSGVLNTDTGLAGAEDTQLPSALAVKTYVDDSVSGINDASEISYDNATSGLTATDVQAAIDEVEGRLDTAETNISTNASDLNDHETETTGAHASSAISYDNGTSGLSATNVKAAIDEVEGRLDTEEGKTQPVNQGGTGLTSYTAGDLIVASGATTLSKLGIGATGRFLLSNGSTASWSNTFSDGAVSSDNFAFADTKGVESQTASSTLNVGTLTNTTTLNLGNSAATTNVNGLSTFDSVSYASADVVSAGPALAVTAANTTFRLQSGFGATLSSVTGAAAGRQIVVVNETGASLTVENESLVDDDPIITGTGADLVIEADAALTLVFDGTNWNVVGGAGAGGGLATEFVSADPAPAANNTHYLVDCSGGPVTITLPDSPQPGAVIRVSDESGTSGTNNITIAGNGNTIEGDSSFIIDVDDGWAQLHWDGTSDWHVDTLAVNATSGILSLGGQSGAAYPTQTFSSTDASITINSSAGDHDIELADTIAGARTFSGAVTFTATPISQASTGAIFQLRSTKDDNSWSGEEYGRLEFYSEESNGSVVPGARAYIAAVEQGTVGARGELVFATGDITTSVAERVRIDRNGNVGIGTSSPGADLDVSKDSQTVTIRCDADTSNTASFILGEDGSTKWEFQSDNGVDNGLNIINQSSTEVGAISQAGAWTLGPSSGLNSSHIIQTQRSGNGGTVVIANANTAVDSTDKAVAYISFSGDATPTAGHYIRFQNAGDGDCGSVSVNGTNSVTYNTSSDARYKLNQRPIAYGLEEVLALNPIHFEWRDGHQPTDIGLVAQEVHPLIPEVVSVPDSEEGKWQMDYSKLTSVLVKAIQELKAELDEAKARIETLEGGA